MAVVGAGWSGLAAAVALAEAGLRVTLFESAPQAGGRARTTELETPFGRLALDNGQHLLVGAYAETLALVARVTGAPDAVLARAPMRLVAVDGLSVVPMAAPAPWHLAGGLLRARGLDCRVVVGGAVLTPEYACTIGADFYAKDAKATVDAARQVFSAPEAR